MAEVAYKLKEIWAEIMGFSKYAIMSSANRDNLMSSLPIEYTLFLSLT